MSVNPFDSGVAVTVPVPALWERVLDALGPAFVEASGPLLAPFVQALVEPLVDVDDLVTDPRGYARLFNLDDSPTPGWLGQWVGVPYDPALSRAQQIGRVRSRGQTRGTPASIVAAAVSTLVSRTSAVPRVDLFERTSSAYRLRVRTYASQTPDPVATAAAVQAAKPATLLMDVEVAPGQTWADLAARRLSYAQLGAYTHQQIAEAVPGQPIA